MQSETMAYEILFDTKVFLMHCGSSPETMAYQISPVPDYFSRISAAILVRGLKYNRHTMMQYTGVSTAN